MKGLVQKNKDNYRISLSDLNQWIMMPADCEVVAKQDLKVTLPAVLDNSGLKRTPLLEPFGQDIQVQQARIKVEKADLLPTFGGQYGWQKIGSQCGFNS